MRRTQRPRAEKRTSERRKPSRMLLPLTLAIGLAGCDRIEDDGTGRFRAAVQPFCALWGAQQLSLERLGSRCPWAPQSGQPAPCAIEHYVDDGDEPRTLRRLATDEQGRVTRQSDHRRGRTLAAWQFQYDARVDHVLRHQYRIACDAPAPEFVRTDRFPLSPGGWFRELPGTAGAGPEPVHATYRIDKGLLEDEAWIDLQRGDQTYHLRVDAQGNIVARSRGDRALSLRQTAADGRVQQERVPGLHPGRNVEAIYGYDADGHLTSLALVSPAGRRQRYRFVYRCDAAPACGPETATPDDDALPYDPEWRAFVPDSCSEQAAYSPNVCDTVARQGAALALSCCRIAPQHLSAVIESPLAKTAVTYMRLETPSGTKLESLPCTRNRETSTAAWRCEFNRRAIATLGDGPADLVLMTDSHQAVLTLAVDLATWARAAQ